MELGFVGSSCAGRSGWWAATAVTFFVTFSVYSQNLVQNGYFDANGGSFDGWQITHTASSSSYSSPNIASPGYGSNPYYARFSFEPGGGEDILSQDIATVVGAVYDVSFEAEDGAGPNFVAQFNFGNFSDNLLNAFAIGPGKWYSGWTNFNFQLTASQLETDLSFNISADTGSEFGLDDISVVQVPQFQGRAVGRTYQVTVYSPSSMTYLQASTNLVDWVCLCTNMPPYTFTDSVSQYPRRFYRAAVIAKQAQ